MFVLTVGCELSNGLMERLLQAFRSEESNHASYVHVFPEPKAGRSTCLPSSPNIHHTAQINTYIHLFNLT